MSGRFRPEVQALRALAVVLVVVYHLRPEALPGGFIGVDVFFVLSGFLITGHLLREHERTGRISLPAFWAARARRILPASLVCIAVTLVAVAAVTSPTLWAETGMQAIASALSVMNWVLAAQAVDYSSATAEATPFQHFWSLGVEEQFYVVWPFVVIGACALAARRKRALPLILGAVVVGSFAVGAVQVSSGDPAAYFSTVGRVWELAVGGLLAIGMPRLPARARAPLAAAGLVTILGGAVLLSGSTPFPGPWALVPVLGTVAVIVAGEAPGLSRAYGARPVQWLGDVSYSLYLWHFPPIVLFALATGSPPGLPAAVAIGMLSLLLAALSHRFVERPVRRSDWMRARPRRGLLAGGVAVAVVVAGAASLPLAEQRIDQQWATTADAVETAGALGAAAAIGTVSAGMTPSPSRAVADESSAMPEGCTGVPRSPTTPTCTGGDPDGSVRVALVGDSHAKQWATAVFAIAEDRGWRVDTFAHASCPFNAEQREVEAEGGVVCAGPNADTLRTLLADPYDVVVTANWASGDFVDSGDGLSPGVAGYAEMWNRLADAGSRVVVIKDVPKPRAHPLAPDCLGIHYDDPAECGMPRDEALAGRDIVDRAAALAPRTEVVDITDLVCDAETCPAVIGNVIVYRDTNHFTDTFVKTLTPFIAARLPADLP